MLTKEDITFLISDYHISDYFDDVMTYKVDPKITINLLRNEVMAYLGKEGKKMKDFPIQPKQLATLVLALQSKHVSSKTLKPIWEEMLQRDVSPFDIIEEKGLQMISDEGKLKELIQNVMSQHPQAVEDYRRGKNQALQFLVGQVMKETRGLADADAVREGFTQTLLGMYE